ncbi:cell-cycle control medial ring component-domain-containing protein [Camillea tinctor]|nr:cell-cycle control medial ring component-domain-containing protein [Camillea tinctor]
MTEVSFAKNFLAALDARPVTLSPDHVQDPKTLQAHGAFFILPKMPKPMSKRKATTVAPGQERSLNVVVKSLRNPPLDLKLSSQTLNTSILDVKTSVSNETGIPVDKLKMLYNKKPVPDSKVLKDLVAGKEATNIEFTVMVIGGAAAMTKPTQAQKEVAQGPSGREVIDTTEFWSDLKGFLLQRVRDEGLAGELTNTFQAAWAAKS